jgi:hypothetical protein
MKITKTQLKQIIKEELGRVLNEASSESWLDGPIARLNKRQIADLLKGAWGREKVSTLAYALAQWEIDPKLLSNLYQAGASKHLTGAQEYKLEDWYVGEFEPGDKEKIQQARAKLLPAAIEMLDSGAHHRQEPGMGRY